MRLVLLLIISVCLPGFALTQKAKDGPTAFSSKQYHTAIPLLSKAYANAKTRLEKGKIAFQLGECAKILGREELALDWYQKAYDNQYGVDALREVAFTLKRLERYVEAKDAFKNLGIEIGSPYEYRKEINTCDIALGWKKIPTPEFKVELMDFNTASADYAPAVYKDNELLFSSDRSSSTGEAIYAWTGNRLSDFFVLNQENATVRNLGTPFNTPDNEGAISFTDDFQTVYFSRCSGEKKQDAFCKIMVSNLTENAWTTPKPLDFQEAGINYGHPSISGDGKTLYFSCQHPEGWGGYDIYSVEKKEDGWATPKLLSRTINTPGNEQFPYIDGDTLYFSSDFHPGMGGLDIFRTYRMANGEWAPVFNLKPPINSGGDDFGMAILSDLPKKQEVLQHGFFTSNRSQGLGNDDIYRFERYPLPVIPPNSIATSTTDPKKQYTIRLEVFVLEKIFADPTNPNSKVLGRKSLANASLEMQVGKTKKIIPLGEDGFYSIEVDPETDYNFLASKGSYLTNAGRFSSKGIALNPVDTQDLVFELEIVLDKIYLNREITLENIYYDFDKWDIRQDAKPTLDVLAQNLMLNPTIRIQLASHTDCRGNDGYNTTLSQKRAEAAVSYLISAGITADRLIAKGFGEIQPAVNCLCAKCTEEEHQANRRTTFSILE